MGTRVLLATLALMVTFALALAAHAEGYPLMADASAPGRQTVLQVVALP